MQIECVLVIKPRMVLCSGVCLHCLSKPFIAGTHIRGADSNDTDLDIKIE